MDLDKHFAIPSAATTAELARQKDFLDKVGEIVNPAIEALSAGSSSVRLARSTWLNDPGVRGAVIALFIAKGYNVTLSGGTYPVGVTVPRPGEPGGQVNK
ncbi:MAG: hypothetical protein IT384_03490 [Deltaproteobacteria bacterium]|nr:hypothetical protein [Deltaproteobacteria bacterium]